MTSLPDHFHIPFGPLHGVEFATGHCLARFKERVGVKGTHGEVLVRLEQWLKQSKPAQLRPEVRLKKLLSHGCRPAIYRMFAQHVLVISGNLLVTIYKDDAKETIPL